MELTLGWQGSSKPEKAVLNREQGEKGNRMRKSTRRARVDDEGRMNKRESGEKSYGEAKLAQHRNSKKTSRK